MKVETYSDKICTIFNRCKHEKLQLCKENPFRTVSNIRCVDV